MTIEATVSNSGDLRAKYATLASKGVRARDAAEQLGVSEEALVALECGASATRLRVEIPAMFAAFRAWDEATALTRNDAVVSEITGRYGALEGEGHLYQIVGDPIDLRLFFQHWKSAYAVRASARGRVLRSVQFFDGAGEAVHKVYAKGEGDDARFDAMVAAFASEDQRPIAASARVERAATSEGDVDRAAFLQAWGAMQNTHDFFGLLRRFGASRAQAMRLAEGTYTRALPVSALGRALEGAVSAKVPLMVFVPNRGCVQIRSGLIERVKVIDGWLNVLEPTFNLHVQPSRASALWRVEKPTSVGTITSVELYDARGENVLMIFGLRKGNDREREDWRALASGLSASQG